MKAAKVWLRHQNQKGHLHAGDHQEEADVLSEMRVEPHHLEDPQSHQECGAQVVRQTATKQKAR
jgi:hypothetical protein